MWHAHPGAISSVQWAQHGFDLFVLTSAADCRLALWSVSGTHVGDFGTHNWVLDQPGDWKMPLEPETAPKKGPEAGQSLSGLPYNIPMDCSDQDQP